MVCPNPAPLMRADNRPMLTDMAPRRPSPPSPPEVKHFTPDEIEQGITKLRRRLEEVQALDPQQIAPDDQRKRNAYHNLETSIAEVFGQNSADSTGSRAPSARRNERASRRQNTLACDVEWRYPSPGTGMDPIHLGNVGFKRKEDAQCPRSTMSYLYTEAS